MAPRSSQPARRQLPASALRSSATTAMARSLQTASLFGVNGAIVTLPAGAPPGLAQVAQRFAQTSQGYVAFKLHRVFDVHGGLQRRHEDLVMNGVYRDGALVRVRVVSYAINGRRAGASDVAGVEQS